MFLAFREFRYAKLRYTLIAAIMILIAWLTFMVSGLANGLAADNASAVQELDADYFVLQKEAERKMGRSAVSGEELRHIQQQIGQEQAEPLSQMMLSIGKKGAGSKLDVTLFGMETGSFLLPDVGQGTALGRHGEVVLSEEFQQKGIRTGDVLVNEDLDVALTVVGFTGRHMYSHTPAAYVTIGQLQEIEQRVGKKGASYNVVALQASEHQAKALAETMPDADIVSKDEFVQTIPGYKEEQGSLTMMTAFLVVIAAFVQAGFFYVLTLQKTSQFGVLKAIGATTSYLAKSVMGQVLALAAAAIAASVLLTFAASMLLPDGMPFVLGAAKMLQYGGLLLLVSAAGAALSLYQIAKIDAIQAIGRVEA